jgi:hypothetical protein
VLTQEFCGNHSRSICALKNCKCNGDDHMISVRKSAWHARVDMGTSQRHPRCADRHAILSRGINLYATPVVPNIPNVPLGPDGVASKELGE